MAFTAEQHRAYRLKMKEQDMCTVCHQNEANGKSVCEVCSARQSKYRKEKRQDYTLCNNCQKKLDEFAIATGTRYCGYCAERRKVNRHRRNTKTGE